MFSKFSMYIGVILLLNISTRGYIFQHQFGVNSFSRITCPVSKTNSILFYKKLNRYATVLTIAAQMLSSDYDFKGLLDADLSENASVLWGQSPTGPLLDSFSATDVNADPLSQVEEFEKEMRKFEILVKLLKLFAKMYKGMPKIDGKRADGEENRLAEFIDVCRNKEEEGELPDVQMIALNTIPYFRWKTKKFKDRVHSIKLFQMKYGDLPIRDGKRELGEERRLAAFIERQKDGRWIRCKFT